MLRQSCDGIMGGCGLVYKNLSCFGTRSNGVRSTTHYDIIAKLVILLSSKLWAYANVRNSRVYTKHSAETLVERVMRNFIFNFSQP